MTNKPEPVVSIGNAASEIARWMADEGVGDEWLLRADVDAILHKHFDSAVTAAVARREAEIVDILKDAAECYWAGDCYGDADTAKALSDSRPKK